MGPKESQFQRGVLAPLSANLAFGPTERNGVLCLAPRGLQTAGSMAQDVGRLLRNLGKIARGRWVLGFEIFWLRRMPPTDIARAVLPSKMLF